MTPPVSLRKATAQDTEFLAAVYTGTRMEELAVTDWSDAQKAEFCRMQFAAQDTHYRQHYPTAEYQVIESSGTPVGRLYVDRWKREIRIMDIALLPGHRGQGIGTRLLRDLQCEAANTGKTLSIHVERMNPALTLYARLGFHRIEDKGVYFLMEWLPPPGSREDRLEFGPARAVGDLGNEDADFSQSLADEQISPLLQPESLRAREGQ